MVGNRWKGRMCLALGRAFVEWSLCEHVYDDDCDDARKFSVMVTGD